MSFFITNTDRLVRDSINNIIPNCNDLYFLVGYFYFSGFQLIYKQITLEQNLKILVGLQAESRISSYIEYSSSNGFPPRRERRKCWYKTVQNIIGHSDKYDNKASYEAFNLFIKKLKNGTLEVRQTKNPCHAKMYIFQNSPAHSQNGDFIGTSITGSSNLSANGLEQNFEINVLQRDNNFVQESIQIFEKLWNESEILATKDTLPEVETELLSKLWFSCNPSPFLVYLKVLIEYFDVHKIEGLKTPSQVLGDNYADLRYQVDAVEQGVRSLNEHNGVIVADVVGLGKSIIATTIAANFNLPVLVIAPPHLIPQWEDYCVHLNNHSQVFSSGKIEDALLYAQKLNRPYLVILDEAHNYRNPDTKDYSNLETLCRGYKVIILSATPFNNRPEDVFALIHLFQIPGYSTLKSVQNLSYAMQQIVEEYHKIKSEDSDSADKYKKISKKIRNIIKEVVIRRNRKDLEFGIYQEDLIKKGIQFPQIAAPKLLEYSFGDYSQKYIETLHLLADEKSQFKAARYRVFSYVKEEYQADVRDYLSIQGDPQKNNANFLKRLLVRRLESSIYSFNQTLENIISATERTLSFFQDKHRAFISKTTSLEDLEDLPLETLEEGTDVNVLDNFTQNNMYIESISHLAPEQQTELAEKGIYLIHQDFLKPEFEQDLKKDITLLKKLKDTWRELTPQNDKKLVCLKNALYRQIKEDPKRKIVLFSEFADTITYLRKKLPQNDGIIKLISYDASQPKKIKTEIRADFDASFEDAQDNYNLLLTTDALSEGINLNRAGTIFNYDIPFNPTRVIQRVGRINRINKKMFDELFIYNFFPTEIGEEEINIRKITNRKITIIDEVFREDTRYLTSDETIKASLLHKIETNTEEVSWEQKCQAFLNDIKKSNPVIYQQAANLPSRVRIGRKSPLHSPAGLLIFGRRASVGVFSFYDAEQSKIDSITDENAVKMFEASEDEKSLPITDAFYDKYQQAQQGLNFKPNPGLTENKKLVQAVRELISRRPQSPYLTLLRELVPFLSKAKLKMIQAICVGTAANVEQIEKRLKENISSGFLERQMQLQEQVERQQKETTVILSVEFIK